jgi:hypothetical protein
VSSQLSFAIQLGRPKLLGHVSQQFNIYRGDPTQAFQNWINQTPRLFEDGLLAVLRRHDDGQGGTLADPADGHPEIGSLKNYHSLVPDAQSLRQAIFEMEQDEVILANQLKRARASEQDFRALADGILFRATTPSPAASGCSMSSLCSSASARLGHVDLRTTARYAATRPEQIEEIADVLDRRHQAARRAGLE